MHKDTRDVLMRSSKLQALSREAHYKAEKSRSRLLLLMVKNVEVFKKSAIRLARPATESGSVADKTEF